MARSARIALILVAVMLLGGCGGDDKRTTAPTTTPTPTVAAARAATSTPAVTHAEFIRKLDATCSRSLDSLQQRFEAAGDDTAKLAVVVHDYRRIAGEVLIEQRRLQPPVEDRAGFLRYMKAQERLGGAYKRMEAALRAGDLEQTSYLIDIRNGARKARTRAALDLGLERCGS